MPHTHEIIDKDNRFVIDPITRTISNESDKTKLIQYDHNSERFTFQCPRMIEGHDMSLSTSVRVQYININKKTREASPGVYDVDDLVVSSDDPDSVVFSWLISRNATKFVGTLSFLVEFICIEDNSNIVYAWHTDIYKYITVDTGMDNGEVIEEKYPDILEKWKNEILAEIPTIDPHPVTRIESLDKNNMVNLRDLDSGAYVLYGYFRPYKGSSVTMAFGSNLSVSIVKKTSESYAQIFYPVNNCVQYLRMTDTDYERKNVYLSDVADSAAKIGDLSNLTTEAKDNLVEAINESAASSVNADWSQSDETAKDYIKNRTHYIETDTEGILLPESSFIGEERSFSGQVFYFHSFDFTSDMPADIYVDIKVEYDGIEYIFEITNKDNTITVGNGSINGQGYNTGEPFFIEISEQTVSGNIVKNIYVFAQETGEHTLSISYISYIVHPLNPIYIEDMYHSGIGEGVIGTGFNGWVAVTNYSAITIYKMAIKGTVYKNVPVDHTTTSSVIYNVGGYALTFNRRDGVMNAMPQDISDSDVEFFGITTVDYPVPDKYIPDWVASKTDISNIKQPDQPNYTETDTTSLAYIKNKKFLSVMGKNDADTINASDYDPDFQKGTLVYFGYSMTERIALKQIYYNKNTSPLRIKSSNTGLVITDDELPYGVMVISLGSPSLGATCINPIKTIPVDNTTIKLNDNGQLTLALNNANGVNF